MNSFPSDKSSHPSPWPLAQYLLDMTAFALIGMLLIPQMTPAAPTSPWRHALLVPVEGISYDEQELDKSRRENSNESCKQGIIVDVIVVSRYGLATIEYMSCCCCCCVRV
jgi:hypothetical protein